MAKNVITLTVTLNKEQAQRQIEEMKVGLKGMKDELSVVQNKLNDRDLWGPKDTFEGLKSREKSLTKQIKLTEKAIQTGVREIEGYENKLAHLSTQNYNTLTQMRTAYANSLKNIRKETDEDLAVYEEKVKALQAIRDEITKRDIDVKGNMTVDKSKEILTKPEDFSTRSINDAIEAMTKLRNIQQADSEEWHTYNNLIKQGSQYLEEFNSKIKTLDMSKVHEGVQTGNISDKDLNTVIRYWESMIEGADKSDQKLSEFNAKLEEARKLQQQRFQQKGESIVQEVKDGNLGGSLVEMQQRLKIMQDYRNTIDSTKPDAFVEVDKAIGRITATIKESQPGFMSFEAAMEKAADIKNFKGTIDELEKIKRTIQEGTTGLELKGKTLETLKEAQLRLDDIADKYKEIQHLNAQKKIDAVSNAMKSEEGLATLSAGDTEEAIRLAKELQKSHDTTGKEYQKLSVFITNAEAQLKKWNDSAKQTVMNKQLQNLTHLSKTALEEQQKFWQGAVDGAERGSQAYEYAAKRLQKVNDQMAVRQRSEANAVIKEINTDGNMGGSLSEMQQRLKLLQEYRTDIDSTKPNAYIEVDKAIASLNQRIKESQAGFMSFDEALEKAKAVAGGTFDGTVEDLEKIQKVLKEGMGEKKLDLLGQADLKEAHSGLDAIAIKLKEIANINAQDKIDAVGANIAAHSPAEIEEAVRLAKELQKSQGTSTRQYKELAVFITEAESQLKKWNDQVKQSFMQYDLSKVTSMSDASLAEQKKYWQEMVNGAEVGSAALQTYKNNLQTVIEEERKRTQAAGKDIVTQYETGNWDKTIGETKEAIKQLEEYRNTLNATTDHRALSEVDQVLSELTKNTKEAERGFISLQDALSLSREIKRGTFQGTITDLEQLKKRLQEIRDTEIKLNTPTAKADLIELNTALDNVDKKIDEVNRGGFDLEKTLKHLNTASIKDLNRAAEELKKQIENASTASATFIKSSANLREVNKKLEESKELWKEKENIITKTAKRLASYVLVYAGFNEIVGKLKEVVRSNLALSDSLADIQKTTGLTTESVAKLSDEINAIDTRSAQKELHDLAYEAGKLGLSAEEDVLAFVRAGNQLLVALGEDLGGAEAVRQLMKVNAVLGETQKLGVEKALLATGSAINEISQTSRASAGPISDMVKRIGAIGAASHLTMADLVALAGTADAMGQSAEVSGTAFNKFLGTLQSNTVDVAYALGLDPTRLTEMLKNEETAIYAIIEMFEKMNLMGEMADLSPIMKDLGSEGARMTQVLTTMAAGIDELKAQVFTSRKAFAEATSVTNEYNIKNESAAAIIERMGNNLKEAFTNSTVVGALTDFLHWLYYLPNALERNRALLFIIRTLLIEIATVSLVKLIAMLGGGLTGTLKTVTKAWKMFNLEAANSILLGGDKHGLWQRNTLRALTFANGINKVKIAFAALGRVISTNPIFFIGTALALAISAFKQLTEETNKAAKAAAEHDAAIRKEQFELENLKLRIENANGANGERAALIQELNNKYGQYLGFMVTEENYLRNQKYIYDLLNAQIERSISLKMREKLLTNISDKYADQQLEAFQDMESILQKIAGIGEGGAKEAVSKLMESIKTEVQNGSKDIDAVLDDLLMSTSSSYKAKIELLNKELQDGFISQEQYDYQRGKAIIETIGAWNQPLQSAISDMMEIETKIADEAATATKLSTANIEALDKKVQDLKREEAMDILDKISNTTNINELTEYQSKLSDFIRQQKQDVSELIAKQNEINSLTFAEINELDDLNNKKAKGVNLTDEEIKRYEILQEKKAGSNKLTEAENKQLEEANAELGKLQNGLDAVESKLATAGKLNLWGDGKTIKDADVNQLVSMYKKLESDGAKIRKGATESIQTSYWKGFEDQKEAIKWYYKEAKTIKDELETRGYNTSGHFMWKGDGNGQKKKAQEEYRAALAALEAYFNERETLIQKKGFEEGKTQVQINQDLERLQTEKLNDEIQLRKLLLNDYYKESTFNPSKYKGVISGTDYFKEKNLEYLAALRRQLEESGVAMEDGMKKQLTDRMVKLSEQVLKLREKINKILLEDNFSEQVKQQYLDSLQELSLLFGLTEQELVDQDKQEGLRRLAYMREWAKESYNLNAQQLQSKVEQEEAFSSWRIGRRAEDYEALLIQLRKFHDDQEEADRKAAERRKKIFDNSEKGIQLQKAASSAEKIGEAGVKDREDNVKFWDRFKNMDLVTDDLIDEKQVEVAQAQLSLYQAKIDASQLYIDQIKKEMEAEHMKARMAIAEAQNELNRKKMMHADTTQAEADLYAAKQYYESLKRQESLMTKDKEEEIAQARAGQVEQYQNIADRYLAIEQNKIARMKEYTDAVVDFSYQMGEAAFGEVEDRQEAGKQLIKSLLTTLKEHLQIKLTELAMEAMFANQSNAMRGNEMIANLTASGMEAGATVAIEGVKATAKETGKLGWKGLIVGAAISAALSGLLGLAMGALNKKKSEIASTTGASTGRLATGMLTYKKGNYPVLGNDGQIYNAKYEGSEMKTGVYGGGAHFGIFSEKKPEAIIDGDTTQRLILYHPDIWQSILTLSKTGRLDRGMRTFASGNMSDFASMDMQPTGDNTSVNLQNEMMEQLRTLMSANMTLLNKLATEGVQSRIDMYGEGGLYKSMKKAETFASKRGYR